MEASSRVIGEHEGVPVHEITLSTGTESGHCPTLQLRICTYGATITSVQSMGEELTLGQSLKDLVDKPGYFGAIVGRFANRIRRGFFSLDGIEYNLALNNEDNHLHGGIIGFDKRVWTVSVPPFVNDGLAAVTLSLMSVSGDEGYPGNLEATVIYTLSADNSILFDYIASTDNATPVNLTNHAYWNLSGNFKNSISTHRMHMSCSHYIPVDRASLIPMGEVANVEGTPFDFTRTIDSAGDEALIGPRLPFVGGGGGIFGFDHCFVIDKNEVNESKSGPILHHAITLEDLESRRRLVVSTSQPGVQVYTGNFLPAIGDESSPNFSQYNAICLETQHFPDSPNQPSFPSCILRAGEIYHHRSKFSIEHF